MDMAEILLSIVVPSPVRTDFLDLLMAGLDAQTDKRFELVLVDGLYEQRATQFAAACKHKSYAVQHIAPLGAPSPQASLGRYMNSGIAAARAPRVLFLRDGSWLPPDRAGRHIGFHQAYPTMGLMGPLLVHPVVASMDGDPLDWLVFQEKETAGIVGRNDRRCDERLGATAMHDAPLHWFRAASESVPIDALLLVNGFDERLDGADGYHEVDLADRMGKQAGLVWSFDPSNTVHQFAWTLRDADSPTNASNAVYWASRRREGYPTAVNIWSLSARRAHGPKELRRASFRGKEFSFYARHDALPSDSPSAYTFVDEAEVRDRHWTLEPNETVLDIGPAYGSYTLTAAAQGARVIALEPFAPCRDVLQDNVQANPDILARIEIRDVGAYSRDGFFDPEDATFVENETLLPECDCSGPLLCKRHRSLRVQALDTMELPAQIDVLKLDVEGAELEVLRGAERLLRTHRPRILVENHVFKIPAIEKDVIAFIESLGLGYQWVTTPHFAVSHTYFWTDDRAGPRGKRITFETQWRAMCEENRKAAKTSHDGVFAGRPYLFYEYNGQHSGSFRDEVGLRERYWHFAPGDVVIDAGPQFGSYTITAAIQGATVHAMEPCPFSLQVLGDNLGLNVLSDRVRVHRVGLHRAHGWFDPELGYRDLIVEPNTLDVVCTCELSRPAPCRLHRLVQVIPLDGYLNLSRLDFLKLDIEGAEVAALEGAAETIKRFAPKMLVEVHAPTVAERDVIDCVDRLGLGYRYESTPYSGDSTHLYFWREPDEPQMGMAEEYMRRP